MKYNPRKSSHCSHLFRHHKNDEKVKTYSDKTDTYYKLRLVLLLSIGLLLSLTSPAYGAFDADGNYYCNLNNIDLEKTIYQTSVDKINFDLKDYHSLNPNASIQELHSFIINKNDGATDSTYYIMIQSKACLESSGINPASITYTSPYLLQVFSAPEFGSMATIIVVISVTGQIVIQRKIAGF